MLKKRKYLDNGETYIDAPLIYILTKPLLKVFGYKYVIFGNIYTNKITKVSIEKC